MTNISPVLRISIFDTWIQIRIQPFFQYMDPDPGFLLTQNNFFNYFSRTNSCLIHISFEHEGIPSKEIKNLEKLHTNLKKVDKIFKIFQIGVSFKLLDPDPYIIFESRRTPFLL